jgi:beta-galactosidase
MFRMCAKAEILWPDACVRIAGQTLHFLRCLLNLLLRSFCHLLVSMLCMAATAAAQNVLDIDATAAASRPQPVAAQLGTSTAADGQTLTVNSQYLLLNGKPWLPVMGEFHYTRVPESEWESEILKMKAAGVQVISTYVIWIHQEEVEGEFDWSGRRDLRHFVQLCAKHGMYVYPRIGPWSHAEVRNGGLPGWVLQNSPVRVNNPVYLREVKSFYGQIGEQLKGLLWKDNGPVIGIQIENEYHVHGPGAGSAHIRRLKQLALQAGLDVPLYTVTGWDGAAIPLDQVLPVYGGYPDAPWTRRFGKLPPSEVFAFRFHNRAAGSMGALGSHGQNSASAYRGTPFLTAEVGSGQEDTYFRRPVIQPADVASIVPVMLGSGANMIGYYMFQGGRNPQGKLTTLQESQRTGYPTDVPVKSYDFQAPLGEFGQERASFRQLKLVNYFLNDFGSLLAPMQVAAPVKQPRTPADLSVARVAARVTGNHAFLFFNNYVRGAVMPARPDFQIQLKLASGMLQVPHEPIGLPSGAFGIWPVHLDMEGHELLYSTAQLFLRMPLQGQETYFFFAIPGIVPEFALAARERPHFHSRQVSMTLANGVDYLRCKDVTTPVIIRLMRGKQPVRMVLFSRAEAQDIWRIDGRPHTLVRTSDGYFSDQGTLHLFSNGKPVFRFGLLGTARLNVAAHTVSRQRGLFREHTLSVPAVNVGVTVRFLHSSRPFTHASTAKHAVPFAPDAKAFQHAAAWSLQVTYPQAPQLGNVFLRIAYTGDVARLYSGSTLLDDNFWNGSAWQLGMRPWKLDVRHGSLRLMILPAPANVRIAGTGTGTARARHHASLGNVMAIPQYQATIPLPQAPPPAIQ